MLFYLVLISSSCSID